LDEYVNPFENVHNAVEKLPILEFVKVTVDGKHTILSLTVNEAINGGGVVNTSVAVAVHPLASVIFTI
jgi:hypothetical protein